MLEYHPRRYHRSQRDSHSYSLDSLEVTTVLNATITRDVLEAIVAPPTTLESNELLRVEPDGIEIHATDRSREAIVEVSASEATFNSYCAEKMETGIDLSKVAEFLDIMDDTDLIQIDIDAERDWVTLTAGTLSYTFSLVGPDDVLLVFLLSIPNSPQRPSSRAGNWTCLSNWRIWLAHAFV